MNRVAKFCKNHVFCKISLSVAQEVLTEGYMMEATFLKSFLPLPRRSRLEHRARPDQGVFGLTVQHLAQLA